MVSKRGLEKERLKNTQLAFESTSSVFFAKAQSNKQWLNLDTTHALLHFGARSFMTNVSHHNQAQWHCCIIKNCYSDRIFSHKAQIWFVGHPEHRLTMDQWFTF